MGDNMVKMVKQLDEMSREELLERAKSQSEKMKSYKYRKALILTPSEGEILESEILPQYSCANVSQFVKKIVKGELLISENPEKSGQN